MSTKYRIQVLPSDYEIGDVEDEAEVNAILERDGAWGFVVKKWVDGNGKCEACGHTENGHWEYVDSCFGFLGNDTDYMMEQALESIPAGTGEIPVLDENEDEINTVSK